MSCVSVYSYTHSVTYVADNILKSLKDIIRLSGLDPSGFVNDWQTYLLAASTWLKSGHLRSVVLEIFDPKTNALITRWDVEISYSWSLSTPEEVCVAMSVPVPRRPKSRSPAHACPDRVARFRFGAIRRSAPSSAVTRRLNKSADVSMEIQLACASRPMVTQPGPKTGPGGPRSRLRVAGVGDLPENQQAV